MATTVDSDFGPIDVDTRKPDYASGRFPHFRMESPLPHGRGAKIWMDGEELRWVVQVKTKVSVNDANHVTITFIAGSINHDPAPAPTPPDPPRDSDQPES